MDPQIAGHSAKVDGIYAGALKSAAELAREQARLVGVHFGAIQANLLKPGGGEGPYGNPPNSSEGAAASVKGVTHASDKGVSGRSIDETVELRKMRQDHPLTRRR